MAALSRSKSKAQYSWWWDSHISPKNSKWLKENLTDMDSKVKTMIKLIEVDEDSFVRRAEVYFRRRPELMKLVEEFYRAYRALAERYDHATGVIRHAHQTMSEAFPDQVPSLMNDDSDPHTPEMQADESLDISCAKTNREVETLAGRKGISKQLTGLEKARKGLNFHEVEREAGDGMKKNDLKALKDGLAKLEAEKQAGLLQYQQALEKLSKLEFEVSQAKEDSRELTERASEAEAEVESLQEALVRVEIEREASLLQYQQCLSRISILESHISRVEQDAEQLTERATMAEKETEVLKEELTQVKAEKEALLGKYLESLEKIANLENKLLLAEDYASSTSERAERAEKQVESLKETIARLTEEKEAVAHKYEECLEKIAALERESTVIQKELTEKQKEFGKLWTCVQEERMRFTEAENAFQSLQNMHSKVQEELRSVATELQKKVEVLKDMEIQNQHLQDDVQKAIDENKSLNELNLSSAVTIRSMQGDILGLKDEKGKLEQELELRVDERNAFQRDIYSLKEELNNLTQRSQDAEDENSQLKESSKRNEAEIAALVEQLGVMEKLMEKNELLESSLADLQTELEGAREKVKALEESCQLLTGENSTLASDKATLISQLQMTTENLEKLSERNSFLENSLFDVNAELEMLRVKFKNLEDSCRLLNDQNSVLVTEKQTLASQLETTQHKLEDLGKRHADLEQRYTGLEEERESTLRRVVELQGCLEVQKQEHDNSTQLNQTKIASLESKICVLQDVGEHMREEFEEELDKAVNAQFDIFILRKSIHDLKDQNTSLMGHCEKLQRASKLSEKLISELENTSYEQEEELRVLSGEIKGLRKGMFQLLEALQSDANPEDIGYDNEDKRILHYILEKLYDIKTSLCEALDDNHALVIEKSVLLAVLWQLKRDVEDLNEVIIFLRQDIEIRNNQLLILQKEMQTLLESNEELILKVREGNRKEVALLTEMEVLREKLFNLQGAYEDLKQEKHGLEDECSCIVGEAVALDNLSFMLENIISEKAREFIELNENYDKLGYDNGILMEKVRIMDTKLEDILAKNIGLEVLLKEAENELSELRVANYQFKDEIDNGKDSLRLKETELSEAEERVRALSSELQKGKDAVELWETVAWTFFFELQSVNVRETLIKEKLHELMREYMILEEENCSKGTDIVELHKRVGVLEDENSEIKARLTADLCAIISLRDSVASLEKHTGLQSKLHETDDEQIEDDQPSYNLSEDKVAAAAVFGGHVGLHDVQGRIQAVEKAVIELQQHAEERYSGLLSDLDSTTRQIQVLKSQTLSRHGSRRFSKRFGSNPEEGPGNRLIIDVPERGDELLMKDIVLDQVSDPSSDGKKNSRRKMVSDDQTLELWENVDRGGSIDLSVGKREKEKDNMSSRHPSSELTVEKELLWVNDEQQESSKRFPEPHQEEDDKKWKFLERLASDVHKLTNLQITVQDLKEKLDITDNFSTKDRSAERDGIKDQLAETEKTVLQLFDYGGKLMKKIENLTSFNSTTSTDSISGGSGRRRRCSEQAQRMSEKIGRLELEVKRIQFLLMKLDNNNNKVGGKSGARAPDGNTRVLLRDYLYGRGPRTPKRRLKTRFCACVRPSAMDD